MIILKYIRRELSYTIITVTAVLTIIAMSNQIATILGKAVHGELAKNAVLYIVAFSMPYFLALLLPIGVFVATYLVFTRLYSEQEMVILQMSGMSKWGLLRIMVVPLLCVTIFATIINLWLAPTVLRYRDILMERAQVVDAVTMLAAGHFQTIAGGKYVVYVQSANPKNNSFSHVFVAERPVMPDSEAEVTSNTKNKEKNRWNIFVSKSGGEEKLPEYGNSTFIGLKNGYQYQGVPGQNNFYRIKFDTYDFELPPQSIKSKLRNRAKSTDALWSSTSLHDLAALQARVNLIIAPIILAIVALAFSELSPRQNRFVKSVPAIVLVLIYYNIMLASEDWLARGLIPMSIGAWWLHLATAAAAFYMLFKK